MTEAAYQRKLIGRIERRFPGCIVQEQNRVAPQGWPDLLILFGTMWAMLEVKCSPTAAIQPNQPYWVEHFNALSFAAFIDPECEGAVLDALQQAFGIG